MLSGLKVIERKQRVDIVADDSNATINVSQSGNEWIVTSNRWIEGQDAGVHTVTVEAKPDLRIKIREGSVNRVNLTDLVIADDLRIYGGDGRDLVGIENVTVADDAVLYLRDNNDQLWIDGLMADDAILQLGRDMDLADLQNMSVMHVLKMDILGDNNQVAFTNVQAGDQRFKTRADGMNNIIVGAGENELHGGRGSDRFYMLGDSGEPDPAQTNGSRGRVTEEIASQDDVIWGGKGADEFIYRPLINAKQKILDKHTRADGSVDWSMQGVAGENGNVHDHWVEGFGNDLIMDYDESEGDRIKIIGHTIEVESITYGSDGMGDYSLITVRSNQGGAGAHDKDPLGTIKVYGDRVDIRRITRRAGVEYGIDQLHYAIRARRSANNGDRVFPT